MNSFFQLYEQIIGIINTATVVLISLAVLGFMWGIVRILFNPGNENIKKEGKAYMLYGIITLFVMTSVWGLVNLLSSIITVQ